MKFWASTAPASSSSSAVARIGQIKKMLKMQIDPAMCMKTKDRKTKCRAVFENFMDISCNRAEFCRFVRGNKSTTHVALVLQPAACCGSRPVSLSAGQHRSKLPAGKREQALIFTHIFGWTRGYNRRSRGAAASFRPRRASRGMRTAYEGPQPR